ncbi:DUF1702 family protein [Streptomyces sp. NPDC001834]|uniref:DUF1702 family protein n=1 Tax=unclassified Streptomyces TaxID=2593676 RepID=UPI00369F9F24
MACSVLDALPLAAGQRLSGLPAGRGGAHPYMAYVGIGWAMARLPGYCVRTRRARTRS